MGILQPPAVSKLINLYIGGTLIAEYRKRPFVEQNCDLEISWAGGEGILFSTSESVSPWKGKHDGECTYVGEG